MPGQKRSVVLIVMVTMIAFVGLWLAGLHSNQGPWSHARSNDLVGSAQEAFDLASRAIQDYLPTMGGDPCRIDPEYRASLSSRSKIWTI